MHPDDKKSCFRDHMGLYAMQPQVLMDTLAAVQAGMLEPQEDEEDDEPKLYVEDGVAVVALHDSLMKKRSKFGGTSTVDARKQIREAAERDDVHSLLIDVNTPGGSVNGVDELNREVAKCARKKYVHAHITDTGASAGIWAIAPATRITCNRTATVGSIGVMAALHDTSKMYDRMGVKVIPVSSGKLKTAGMDGTKITKGDIANLQARIDRFAGMFFEAVQQGRNLTAEQMGHWKDGGVEIGEDAVAYGLVDAVADYDDILAGLKQRAAKAQNTTLMVAGHDAPNVDVELTELRINGVPVGEMSNVRSLDYTIAAKNPAKKAGLPLDLGAAILADWPASKSETDSELDMKPEELKALLKENNDEIVARVDKRIDEKLEARLKDTPAPKAETPKAEPDVDALAQKKADELFAKRELAVAKHEAAEKLTAQFGKPLDMTEDDFSALFANLRSTEEVEARYKIERGSLKKLLPEDQDEESANAPRGDNGAAYVKALEEAKQKFPHDNVRAVREARRREPDSYLARMRWHNRPEALKGATRPNDRIDAPRVAG